MFHSFPNLIHQYLYLTLLVIVLSINELQSTIIVQFPRKDENIFWTGENLSGTIQFVNKDRSKLKMKSIEAQLIGTVQYTEKTATSSSSIKSYRQEFFNKIHIVHSENKKKNFILSSGNHTWSFRFSLDKSLPPSFGYEGYNIPFIQYFLYIRLVRSEWYKRSIKTKVPITLKHMSPSYNVTRVETEQTNEDGIRVRASINKNVLNTGEKFSFTLDIHNPKQYPIHQLSMKLLRYLDFKPTFTACGPVHPILEKLHQFQDINFKEIFQFQITNITLPTFTHSYLSKGKNRSFAAYYQFQFDAVLHNSSKDIRLNLPIIITNHRKHN